MQDGLRSDFRRCLALPSPKSAFSMPTAGAQEDADGGYVRYLRIASRVTGRYDKGYDTYTSCLELEGKIRKFDNTTGSQYGLKPTITESEYKSLSQKLVDWKSSSDELKREFKNDIKTRTEAKKMKRLA